MSVTEVKTFEGEFLAALAELQLRDFITRHADARFQEWKTPPDPDAPQPPPTNERFKTVNRAGWKRLERDTPVPSWHFYLTADGWAEALRGLDRRQAAKVLIDRGFIRPGKDGRASGSFIPPGHAKVRLYHALPEILDVA